MGAAHRHKAGSPGESGNLWVCERLWGWGWESMTGFATVESLGEAGISLGQ